MEQKISKNLLISAVGEGKRMQMFTFENVVPKCLLSAGGKTILETIIDCYENIVTDVYVICRTCHKQMIASILDYKGYKNVTLIDLSEETKSPMQTLYRGIRMIQDWHKKDWYINWSDVFCNSMPIVNKTTIFVDDNHVHRNFAFRNADNHGMTNVVSTTGNLCGNVPGIFYVKASEMKRIFSFEEEYQGVADIDKILGNDFNAELVKLQNIVDTGDYLKYTKYMSSQSNIARYFNKIEIHDKYVTKQPISEQGFKLHDIELRFYRKFGHEADSLCKLLDYDFDNKIMKLEKIKGTTCQKFVDSFESSRKVSVVNKVLKQFDTEISKIHDIKVNVEPTETEEIKAAHKEFVEMVETRVNPCLGMINSVIEKLGIESIEGMPITKDFNELLAMIEQWFDSNKYDFDFGICHGDPNTDNSMMTTSGDIKFIDPRGYFGGLTVLGWSCIQYDYAKFAYGFSGYSRFTNSEFIAMKVVDGDVECFIGDKEIKGITDVSIFDMNIDEMTKILIGIIWVKLTSYIINSPTKSILAYLYGNALLTKLLK